MLGKEWRKATASDQGANCLEARWKAAKASGHTGSVEACLVSDGGTVMVRDSKDQDGPVVEFTPAEWGAFLDGAKKGEFDIPGT